MGCTLSSPDSERAWDCLLDVRVCMLALLRMERSGGSRDWRDVGSIEKTVDDILFCGKVISSKMGPQGRKGGIVFLNCPERRKVGPSAVVAIQVGRPQQPKFAREFGEMGVAVCSHSLVFR